MAGPPPLPWPGAPGGESRGAARCRLPGKVMRRRALCRRDGRSSRRWPFKMYFDLVQLKARPNSSLELLEKAKFSVATTVTFVSLSLWLAVGGLCVVWTCRCPQITPTVVLLPTHKSQSICSIFNCTANSNVQKHIHGLRNQW